MTSRVEWRVIVFLLILTLGFVRYKTLFVKKILHIAKIVITVDKMSNKIHSELITKYKEVWMP